MHRLTEFLSPILECLQLRVNFYCVYGLLDIFEHMHSCTHANKTCVESMQYCPMVVTDRAGPNNRMTSAPVAQLPHGNGNRQADRAQRDRDYWSARVRSKGF